MHWLQSLDTALFHFLNSTLANPCFDRLMPILSGEGVPWLAAVVLAVPVLLWFGPVRLRLCVLLMVLVVSLGDPLVVGTVKDAVLRAAPVCRSAGCAAFWRDGNGLRPAHARRLAAARRMSTVSRRPMPPIGLRWPRWPGCSTAEASGSCFRSRRRWPFRASITACIIPATLRAGALLGAGYAIALVVLSQRLWNLVGKKCFQDGMSRCQTCSVRNTERGVRNQQTPNSELRTPNSTGCAWATSSFCSRSLGGGFIWRAASLA